MRSKAHVHYLRIHGTKKEKLAALSGIQTPDQDDAWTTLKIDDWHSKFVPDSTAGLTEFAPLDWIFPWSHSGVQFKRKWPIGSTENTLARRWRTLVQDEEHQSTNFHETADRPLDKPNEHLLSGQRLESFMDNPVLVQAVRYGYRSFDRQYVYPDGRLCDRPRPQLWESFSLNQLYFATLSTTRFSRGPALTVSPYLPDLHFFRGSFGAKDIHPLYRTNDTSRPNVSSKLRETLSTKYDHEVTAEDVALYAFGLLGTGAFTTQFQEELTESPARVPFTTDYQLFQEVRDFGQALVFEQTWGERCSELNQFGQPTRTRYRGQAQIHTGTPPQSYPEQWSYDAESHQLTVGEGVFDHVLSEVMEYEVSGMNVVGSWLGYRMKNPAGKSSSPLDQIQADTWELDRELLELVWQVEFFVNAESEGARLLQEVVTGALIPVKLLGPPEGSEAKSPARKKRTQQEIF